MLLYFIASGIESCRHRMSTTMSSLLNLEAKKKKKKKKRTFPPLNVSVRYVFGHSKAKATKTAGLDIPMIRWEFLRLPAWTLLPKSGLA